MRSLKAVALIVMASTIVVALVGVTSASAKNITLCKENVKECPEKSRYPAETTITRKLAEGTTAKFEGVLNAECSGSKISGKSENQQGSTIDGTLSELTFEGCNCTVNVLNAAGWWRIVRWSPVWHEQWWWHTGFGRPEVLVKCGFVDCVFTGEPIGEFEWEGGSPATVYAVELELERASGGFLCGSAGFFTATYTVTSPNPVYVTEVT